MKNHCKRLLSLALAILMVASLLPVSALPVSAETTWTEVDTWDEFTAALGKDGNIKLTGDITQSAQFTSSKKVTIDFNGHKLTMITNKAWAIAFNGTVILQDTSTAGNGGLYAKGTTNAYQLIRIGGTMTINSGEYKLDGYTAGNPTGIYTWGTTTVNGGTFIVEGSSTGAVYGVRNVSGGKMTINGGTFTVKNSKGTAYGLNIEGEKDGNNITVKKATVSVTAGTGDAYGLAVGRPDYSKDKGKIVVPSDAVNVSVTTESASGKEIGVYIRSGTLDLKSDKLTVDGAVSLYDGTTTITAGTFKSDTAVWKNASAKVNLNGGQFLKADGTQSSSVTRYLDSTKYQQNESGAVVAYTPTAPVFALTIGDTTTEYTDYTAMIDAINADGTGKAKITLLQDVQIGVGKEMNVPVEIDLNNKTITTLRSGVFYVKAVGTEGAVTKIYNGTILTSSSSVPIYIYAGALQMENVTVYGCSTMPVCYSTPNGDYAADSYVKNCNLITNRYYVFSYRTSTAAQTNMNVLFEDTNLINLYTKASGGEVFLSGHKETTGQYTLGKNVNIYAVYNMAQLERQTDLTPGTEIAKAVAADGYTIEASGTAATYSEINAILAQIEPALGFTEGQCVYNNNESIWTTNPSLYKWATVEDTAVATIGDAKYASLTAALEAAEAGQTVVLQKAVDGTEDLVVEEGVALDLNGKDLTAGSLTVFGSLTDGAKGGEALVKTENILITNGYLPIYDAANGGYRIFKHQVTNMGVRAGGENVAKFGFRLTLDNAEGYALLAAGGTKLTMTAAVSWTGENSNSMTYPFSDATLQAYGEAVSGGRTNATIVLTVSGLDVLGENGTFTMTPGFASTTTMTAAGTTSTWSAANA